jgi:hypothetical protein
MRWPTGSAFASGSVKPQSAFEALLSKTSGGKRLSGSEGGEILQMSSFERIYLLTHHSLMWDRPHSSCL